MNIFFLPLKPRLKRTYSFFKSGKGLGLDLSEPRYSKVTRLKTLHTSVMDFSQRCNDSLFRWIQAVLHTLKTHFPSTKRTKWKSCWEISSLALKWKHGWGGWMGAFTPSSEDLLLIPIKMFSSVRGVYSFWWVFFCCCCFFLHVTTTRSAQLILNVLVKISTTVLKLIIKLFQQKLLQSRHLIDFLALGLLEWHCKSISSGVYPFLG